MLQEFWPQKRWMVTGAAGFIGSHLVERLLKLEHQVVALDNFATGTKANLDAIKHSVTPEQWERFSFVEGDIRDADGVRAVFEDFRPEIVLHQAALGSVPRSLAEPVVSHAVNVDGFVNVIDAARLTGTKRLVYASSSSVYGDNEDGRKVESRIGNQLSPYATTKRTNELYAQVYGRSYGLETVGLRYFNVFGPRQDPEGQYAAVVPRWLAALSRSEKSVIFGDGSTSRDFCFIANVVQANLLAGTAPSSSAVIGGVANIACGATTSLKALWTMLRDEIARVRGVSVDSIPAVELQPFRKGDILHSLADISLAREALSYHPTHSVQEGVTELVSATLGAKASLRVPA
jgi:UDP-N-acetylglucosamine 4-epimerase